MSKLAIFGAILVVFLLGVLYIGTTHRDRCIKNSEVGCTILPWSGHSNYVLGGNSGWGGTPVIP